MQTTTAQHTTLPSLLVTATTTNTSNTTHTYTHRLLPCCLTITTTTIIISATTTTLSLPSLLLPEIPPPSHRQTNTEREGDRLQEETVLGDFLACSMQGASLRLLRFKHNVCPGNFYEVLDVPDAWLITSHKKLP